MCFLMLGRYGEGFAEYEARYELLPPSGTFEQMAPRWDGSPLDGRTILLWAEQGFGDTLQFVRYAQLVADRGGRVLVSSQVPLLELMKTAAGVSGPMLEIERGNLSAQFRLLSLPLLMRTQTINDVPRTNPYLFASEDRIAAWAERIGPAGWAAAGWLGVVGRSDEPRCREKGLPAEDVEHDWNDSGACSFSACN